MSPCIPSSSIHVPLKNLLLLPASIRAFSFAACHHYPSIPEAVHSRPTRTRRTIPHPTMPPKEKRAATSVKSYSTTPPKDKKTPAVPRPSSSVLLISPNNQVLLLQRVKQSSSFPSAHVFPGGNVSEFHDGRVPEPTHPSRHIDSDVYRMAAIRETFEESGILLARNNGFGRLIEVPQDQREEGRKSVHSNQVSFTKWLAAKGGRADVDGLTPFTRWVTPTNVPKRFTTQMYLYFLPTLSSTPISEGNDDDDDDDEQAEVAIPSPTTDGGKEHTTARFLPASAWLRLAQEGRIIMFPPQFFLLHRVAQFLDGLKAPTDYASVSREALPREELETRRKKLLEFAKFGTEPSYVEACISPTTMPPAYGKQREDGRQVLALSKAGPELEGTERKGVSGECVLVEFKREGPRRLAVISRAEALESNAKL